MKVLLIVFVALLPLTTVSQSLSSGLSIGEECPAFDPWHVSGPDKNSTACPMCKYGSRQGVMIWVNDANWKSLTPIMLRLEEEIKARGLRQFRVFIMYMNPEGLSKEKLLETCRDKAKELKLDKLALTCLIGPEDHETAGAFRINPDKAVKNTVMVYSRRRVAHKVINLRPEDLNDLMKTCDEIFTRNPL